MSFRTRVTLVSAVAVAVAVLLASAALYLSASRTLYGGVDEALADLVRVDQGGRVQALPVDQLRRLADDRFGDERRGGRGGGPDQPHGPGEPHAPGDPDHQEPASGEAPPEPAGDLGLLGPRAGEFGGAGAFVQIIDSSGSVLGPDSTELLPVGDIDIAVADATLGTMRWQLGLVSPLGIALAIGFGLLVSRRAVAPVRELTDAADRVAHTRDLSHRIEVRDEDGGDELARLARTFNGMLANLEQARRAQHQLVADASHELRTPLTSLRTNIEVLASGAVLDPADHRDLLDDVVVQLDEFERLVGALVELARGDEPVVAPEDFRLDDLVEAVVVRFGAYAQGTPISLETAPTTVSGVRDRVERAVSNLLDNALKYGGGTAVEVAVTDGTVTVRDHGPGIGGDDLAHVFDRFYRSAEARGRPGSGLGLSIVRQTAEAHGGRAYAVNADGGGARFRLQLPTAAASERSGRVVPARA